MTLNKRLGSRTAAIAIGEPCPEFDLRAAVLPRGRAPPTLASAASGAWSVDVLERGATDSCDAGSEKLLNQPGELHVR
jgi:hypothetical protein